ncbi:cysteine desulfurase family protein [Anaerobranca californiensis DSM 14826]|uniref:cysteine desulfurase n=1 Tax=Anaerobranca californiensis DSM 14826 TaxID=1120989 RepID=A0A1M6M2H0_9FIRM|nr:aminotransferase class V-fold PLP-dependent enzyme [Anaerobranca californiensis]SHJ77692.1 cysteine desulfurase family protein [Anaerobranca californiensis DSM 14826]
MIYLDNGATSFPKPEEVYKAHDYGFRNYGANPGRGGHSLARECARVIYNTREKIREFINAKNTREIVFTSNTTEALNQGIFGAVSEGDHIIISKLEHNSVWRPVEWLRKNLRIELDFCEHDKEGYIILEDLERKIKSNTKLVVINHCSNVFGTMQNLSAIGEITRRKGVLLLVDGAQSLGFEEIDVQKMGIDMLAFAGHKGLLGPMGTGGLYIREDILLKPLKTGGTGSKSESPEVPAIGPERYESGTMNTAGIYALGVGIDFIKEQGLRKIKAHKIALINRLIDGLEGIVTFYGPQTLENKGPVISFNVGEMASTEVAFILDTVYNIAVRAGLHCSPLAHKFFGTLEQGTIRVTPGIFNTLEEIDVLINAIKEIRES